MSNDSIVNQYIGIVRGDTKEISIVSIQYKNGDLYTLKSTDKILMDVKKTANSPNVLIHKELTAEDYVDGELIIKLLPSETSKLEKGTYVYDIRLVMDADNVFTIKRESKIIVVDNVTELPEGVDVWHVLL